MALLDGKKLLITGVISERSIAYGIAKACRREGAELAFSYVGERFKDRVTQVANSVDSDLVFPCDVSSDQEIDDCISALGSAWSQLDGLVHAIAFAPREAIAGEFLDGISREAFRQAHDISAYSFPALAKAALPLLRGPQNDNHASLLSLSYLGAERVVKHYNTMGVAKASLEACVRYLANNLGPMNIRVNGISAGPVRTLAAAGIKGFSSILRVVQEQAPLRRNVTIEEIGNVAAFLLSDQASAVTGEITHVDCGFSTVVALGE